MGNVRRLAVLGSAGGSSPERQGRGAIGKRQSQAREIDRLNTLWRGGPSWSYAYRQHSRPLAGQQ